MDWSSTIATGLSASLPVLIVYLARRPAAKPAMVRQNGSATLYMPKYFEIAGWVMIGLAVAAMSGPGFQPGWNVAIAAAAIALFFGGLGVWSVLSGRNHTLTFDQRGFTVADEFGRTDSLGWDDVTEYYTSKLSGNVIIKGAGKKFVVSPYLRSYLSFEQVLAERGA